MSRCKSEALYASKVLHQVFGAQKTVVVMGKGYCFRLDQLLSGDPHETRSPNGIPPWQIPIKLVYCSLPSLGPYLHTRKQWKASRLMIDLIGLLSYTPLKINMEHNHGGLVQIIFLSKWVICRFHVNLPGCVNKSCTQCYRAYGNAQGTNNLKSTLPNVSEKSTQRSFDVAKF